MLIGARTAAWDGKALPYDEELEYLESNGNQYINTGIALDVGSVCRIDAQTVSNFGATQTIVCGSANYGSGGTWFGNQGGYWTNGGGNVGSSATRTELEATWYANSQVLTGNGRTATMGTVNKWGEPFYLFNANFKTYCRVWSMSLSNGDETRRDFLPVLKSGVPCMYDRVSGELFYNQVAGHQFGYKKKDGTIVSPT